MHDSGIGNQIRRWVMVLYMVASRWSGKLSGNEEVWRFVSHVKKYIFSLNFSFKGEGFVCLCVDWDGN